MPDQPGWYPDPAQPEAAARWHDGTSWTPHVRPGTPPPIAVQGHGLTATAPVEPQVSMFGRSLWSTFSLAASALYLLAFLAGNIFFLFLLLPVLLAVRGYKRHEPIAVPALVVGIVVFGINLYLNYA